MAAPWARRTQRLADAQQTVGLAAGGSGGTRLCVSLAMDAGIDLLLTLIRNVQLPERPTPRVLGVDDWANRKGHTYGTILVDLEQGAVVDVLPDRTAESLEAWSKANPGVEIVSRDRAGAYAQGARQGAPNAIQVADRWHLLKSLTDAVYKALQKHRMAIQQKFTQSQSMSESFTVQELPDIAQPSAADRARQQRKEVAHRLHQQGWTYKRIEVHIGVCSKTVSRYINSGLPSTPLRRSRRRQLLDPYRSFLIEPWNAGCHNATQLCREIQAQGFAGQYTIVRHFVSALRQASGLPPWICNATGKKVHQDPTQRPLTLRMLAHFVGRSPDKLDENEQESVDRLDTNYW